MAGRKIEYRGRKQDIGWERKLDIKWEELNMGKIVWNIGGREWTI